MAEQSIEAPKRQLWFDAARGIAICFIVFHHGISSVITNYNFSNIFIEFYRGILFISMPLFFFLSGIFLKKSLSLDVKAFFKQKMLYFLYFYIVWNTISVIIRAALSQFANNQVAFSDVFILFWDPTFTLWFMYAMFWGLGLIYLLNKLQIFEQITITLIAVTILQAANVALPFFLSQLISYFPLLLIGMLFSAYWKNLFIRPTFSYEWLLVFITAVVGIVLVRLNYIDKKAGDFYYPVTLLASLSVVYLMSMFRHSNIVALFAYVGERSLYIYLMHSIPVAAFRNILMKLGMAEHPELAILLSSTLTIACSLLIYNMLRNIKIIKYLFTMPPFLLSKRI